MAENLDHLDYVHALRWLSKRTLREAPEDARLREGSYQLSDGRSVYYQDTDTVNDAADLYTVISELHTTGSPNLENQQALSILGQLQHGQQLSEAEVAKFLQLLKKYRPQVDALRRSRDKQGQDYSDIDPTGQGRIGPPTKESERMKAKKNDPVATLLRKAADAPPEKRGRHMALALAQMRESTGGSGPKTSLATAMGIDPSELSAKKKPKKAKAALRLQEAALPGDDAPKQPKGALASAMRIDPVELREDAKRRKRILG